MGAAYNSDNECRPGNVELSRKFYFKFPQPQHTVRVCMRSGFNLCAWLMEDVLRIFFVVIVVIHGGFRVTKKNFQNLEYNKYNLHFKL